MAAATAGCVQWRCLDACRFGACGRRRLLRPPHCSLGTIFSIVRDAGHLMDSINTSTAVHRLGKVVRRLREKDPGGWAHTCNRNLLAACWHCSVACRLQRVPPLHAYLCSGAQGCHQQGCLPKPGCLQACPSGWCRMRSTCGWWRECRSWRRARARAGPLATALGAWPTRCGAWQVGGRTVGCWLRVLAG